ncbi:hypothetical protein [Thorsellia kenyensis]|uniref:YpfN family protein n=1 Tax=Thorsellia kenyensis TaxID=1549888 RepID=A0ABV6C7F2_9GAMM
MEFLEKYWWLIIIFLIGVFINHLVELNKIDTKKYYKKPGQKNPDETKKE